MIPPAPRLHLPRFRFLSRWILLLTLAISLPACGGKPGTAAAATQSGAGAPAGSPSTDQPPMVRVATVERRPVQRIIETTGFLESLHRVSVLSEVSGRVHEVLVDEGEPIEEGQVLARLDDREALATVRQVDAQLADRRVRAQLMEVEAETAAGRVEQNRIDRDQAKNQHQRNLEIDPGLISAQELEDSQYALDNAEQSLRVAALQARKAELEALAALSAIEELEARLEVENVKLQDHQILAPIDGVVTQRMVRGGETVSTNTELFTVVDQNDLVCYLRRPQRELPLLLDATEVAFTTDAVPDRDFLARIDVVSPVIDQDTGSFRVRVRISRGDDGAELLRPGMFVRAKIRIDDQHPAVMVPKQAVLNEGSQSVVFVVRDGIAQRVELQSGLEERDFVESLDTGERGLSEGDLVVVSGQASLRDNTAVEIVED